MGFFFTFSTLEGPTNAYYFVILKVLLIYFGNLQHEKGFGFQSLKGDLLHVSSWGSKGRFFQKVCCIFLIAQKMCRKLSWKRDFEIVCF